MRFDSQIIRGPLDLLHYHTLGKRQLRRHILIACMPKSGSTYLSRAVVATTDFREASLVRWRNDVENDINLEEALRKNRYDYVSQIHVKYNDNTAYAIRRFGITPIVVVRNIFDCVVSFRDHMRQESPIWPFAHFNEKHLDLPDDELEAMIAQLVIPWYFDFFISWKKCEGAHWVVYAEMVEDPIGTLMRICAHAGIALARTEIESRISELDPYALRKNVGVVGRGDALTEETKELIQRYRLYYPDVDFSLIGLDAEGKSSRYKPTDRDTTATPGSW